MEKSKNSQENTTSRNVNEIYTPEKNSGDYTPTRIEPKNSTEFIITWNSGESFALSYFETRFECPCAGCIDEHTGKRILKREMISPTIRPLNVGVVGRYALNIAWSDGHSTGMYHFDRLYELCLQKGLKLS